MTRKVKTIKEANQIILSAENIAWASSLDPKTEGRILAFKASGRSLNSNDCFDKESISVAKKEFDHCPSFAEDIILYRCGCIDDPSRPVVSASLLKNVATRFRRKRFSPLNIIKAKKGSKAIPVNVLDRTKISDGFYRYHPDSEAEYLIDTAMLKKRIDLGFVKYYIYI